MKKLIGIDASKAAMAKRTGIENFVYQLILALSQIDKENDYLLFTNKHLPEELLTNKNFQEIYIPFPKFWNKFRLPLALYKYKPEVYIQPAHTIPAFAPDKTIAVFHDLAWVKFPKAYSKKELLMQKIALRNIVSKAKIIACVSKSAKNDLDSYIPEAKTKTKVIYIGGNDRLKPLTHPVDRLHINEKYFVTIGRLEERKNTKNIILAFNKFKEKGLPHKLIIVGKPGFGSKHILGEISSSPYKKDIKLIGYLEENKLNDILSGAEALIFASLYEGFGMPAIEAMQAGTAVITSNISSLPEIVGDAAILVDPHDFGTIASTMDNIASDPKLKEKLIQRGLVQAKLFNWQKTASEYLKLMEKL